MKKFCFHPDFSIGPKFAREKVFQAFGMGLCEPIVDDHASHRRTDRIEISVARRRHKDLNKDQWVRQVTERATPLIFGL
jgi:hypothetical protein